MQAFELIVHSNWQCDAACASNKQVNTFEHTKGSGREPAGDDWQNCVSRTWLAVADSASARAVARSRMLSKYGCFSSWRERGRSSFGRIHTAMKSASSRLATLPNPAGRTPCEGHNM